MCGLTGPPLAYHPSMIMPSSHCKAILEKIFLNYFDEASLRALFAEWNLEHDLQGSPVPYRLLAHSAADLAFRHALIDPPFIRQILTRAPKGCPLAEIEALGRCTDLPGLQELLEEESERPWPPESLRATLEKYAENLKIEATSLSMALKLAGARGALPMVNLDLQVTAEAPNPVPEVDLDHQLFGRTQTQFDDLFALPGEMGPGPHRLTRLLAGKDARYILMGAPGSGKTLLLVQTALELLDAGGRVPLLLDSNLFTGDPPSCHGLPWSDEFRSLAKEAIRRGRAVLLVDNFDRDRDPGTRIRDLTSFAARHSDIPMVVACRRPGHHGLPRPFYVLQISTLSPAGQERLLGAWLDSPDHVSQIRESLIRDKQSAKLAESPLALTLIASLVKGGATFQQQRVTFLRHLVAGLWQRSFHLEPPARFLSDSVEVFNLLAWVALRLYNDQTSLQVTCLERLFGENPRRSRLLRLRHRSVRQFLVEISELTDLIVPLGPVPSLAEEFAFPHQLIWQFLVASALVRHIETHTLPPAPQPGNRDGVSPTEEVGRVLILARSAPQKWAGPLALACNLLGPSRAHVLLRWIQTLEDSTLTIQTLAESEGLSHGHLLDVLGLEEDWRAWDQRARRIQELVDQARDPLSVVRVLDQIRSGTRDGSMLYWISAGLEQIATRHDVSEFVKQEARAAAGRIFCHMEDTREEALTLMRDRWTPIPALEDQGLGQEHAFEAQRTPVSWRLYLLFDPAHRQAIEHLPGGIGPGQIEEYPVYNITWYAAEMFARWVGGRLPTVREWLRACAEMVAPSPTPEVSENSAPRSLRPVGGAPRSQWGLTDVRGCVWEWSADLWPEAHDTPSSWDPPRVALGGSWRDVGHLLPGEARLGLPSSYAWITVGVRVFRS